MFESYKKEIRHKNILSVLPYMFYRGSAVVYNNKLHILGSYNQGNNEDVKHYSWDGTAWVSESTLPYSFDSGSAVVYGDKIHILGGVDHRNAHYAWNGTTWSSISTIPRDFFGTAVVYQNKIHALGLGTEDNDFSHYSFDGSDWDYTSEISYQSSRVSNIKWYDCAVHNGKIMVDDKTRILQWDGSSWTRFYGQGFYDGAYVTSYNGWLYGLGSYGYSSDSDGLIYKFDGSDYDYSHGAIPYGFHEGAAAIYNNALYLIGGGYSPKMFFNLSSSNNFI